MDAPATWAEIRPLLRSILRPATYGSLLKPGDTPPWRIPITTFLHELVAIDLPEARLIVTTDNTTAWGVTGTDLFVAGRENVAALHPPGSYDPGTEGVFVDADQSSYITSAILTPGWLASFAQPNGPRPVAFVPTEDTLVIGYERQDLFDTAAQLYGESDRGASPEALTAAGNALTPYLDAGPHPLRSNAIQARAQAAARQYAEQAGFLAQLYEEQLIETFVAATQLIDTEHGKWSAAVWGEGVLCELPEVDYVFFANDDGRFAVPFSVVIDLVGIQPTPGYFPPRYRVNNWPDPDVMAALRTHAVPVA
ncbi:hypothetical protein PT015_21950 [Candidatus Mycobacterium wuenschmannii]|uniref:Uncharacterized protein n=1 Tax=Candidatus Mycobacterium wuenschmannii TaxID=3027808 RepID=A0ABY8VX12_9MYCO|nr:hypothetical protein [Candidatus Mycobacterium wuenschmannii]WIM87471.1 hypothetical protein PT015_21950 [Candidatus Mycobacterium wuenschmannii]